MSLGWQNKTKTVPRQSIASLRTMYMCMPHAEGKKVLGGHILGGPCSHIKAFGHTPTSNNKLKVYPFSILSRKHYFESFALGTRPIQVGSAAICTSTYVDFVLNFSIR